MYINNIYLVMPGLCLHGVVMLAVLNNIYIKNQ